MLKFMRNKLVNIERCDQDTLLAHGILDDDIYGLEITVTIGLQNLRILDLKGKWNRWTTPECPRAIPLLQEAVGFHIEEDGFSQKVHKIVGRRACRHFANLLLECCHCAKEAAVLVRRQDAKAKDSNLTSQDYPQGAAKDEWGPSPVIKARGEGQKTKRQAVHKGVKKKVSKEMVVDLHVHTSPASPCSSAPVEALIKEAKKIGLNGICFTDHNYAWDPGEVENLRQKHGFLILRGNEITTEQGDMLVFGLDQNIEGIIKLEELREQVNAVDGFMIVAHPFRGFLTFGVGQLGLTPEKAMERSLFKYVDAVEVLNSKVTEKENSFASEVARGLGLPATGGSDAHEVSEVGLYATQFSEDIQDERDLVKALKEGNYSPVCFRRGQQVSDGH